MMTSDQFIEALMHEKYNIIKMWIKKGPNVHELVVHESRNTSS
jgi:hypothetical protein